MKNSIAAIILFFLLNASCKSEQHNEENKPAKALPEHVAAGEMMAADSMPILEDLLNKPYFSVKVLSTEYTDNYGTYKVVVDWAKNHAESEFSMPKGGEKLKPVLHKANEPYTYDVGFYYEDEPDFYEYYKVSAAKGEIKMKYSKAYSFK